MALVLKVDNLKIFCGEFIGFSDIAKDKIWENNVLAIASSFPYKLRFSP